MHSGAFSEARSVDPDCGLLGVMEGLNETQNCTYLCCGCHAVWPVSMVSGTLPNGRSQSTTPTCTIRPSTSKAATAPISLGNATIWNGGGGGLVCNFSHMIGFKAEFQGYGSATRTIIVPAGNPFLPGRWSSQCPRKSIYLHVRAPNQNLQR